MKLNRQINSHFNINSANNIEDFENPRYIVLPVLSHSKIFVNNKDLIKKNQVVLETKEGKIVSPISGQVVGTSLIIINNNVQTRGLIIENDYKEATYKRVIAKKRLTMKKVEIIDMINQFELLDYRSKFLLSKKLESSDSFKFLVVNGIENEPNVLNKRFIMKEYSSEILEVIECLMNSFAIPSGCITVKNTEGEIIEKYQGVLGMFPEISLKAFPDFYPIGDFYFLKEHFQSKVDDQKELLILDVEDLWHLYIVLKTGKNVTEQFLTVTGDKLDREHILKIKYGTKAIDILKQIGFNDVNNVDFIANGLIKGIHINNINNFVLNDRIKALFIMNKVQCKEYDCLNCGRCNDVCPLGLDPKTKKSTDYCLKCNLCSYFCPAHIKLNNRGENNEK